MIQQPLSSAQGVLLTITRSDVSYWALTEATPEVISESVEIPKSDGKVRTLGIPTVSDRVAQMVVKMCLEPEIEPHFHPDSYGYRPKKSAHDALGMARQRCWRYNWCVDLDIKGFFDNLDHELVMRAVRKHTGCKWVLLYIEPDERRRSSPVL